jgi:hypothetical protein
VGPREECADRGLECAFVDGRRAGDDGFDDGVAGAGDRAFVVDTDQQPDDALAIRASRGGLNLE